MSESRVGHHLLGRALGDDLAAVDAGGRADVDDVVGLADGVLVMLDDDDGVAEIAEVAERVEEAVVVALVEADRRLVEDVEDAGQARADLRGEADALALAAGERAGVRGEGQVVEADIDEEVEALADLLEDALGDLVLLRGERRGEGAEPGVGLPDREVGDLGDVEPVELDRERLGLEALAVAGLAGRRRTGSARSPRASRRSRSPSSGARDWG